MGMIYLDNAATTYPKPQSVTMAVQNALKQYSANPGRGGHHAAIKVSEAVFYARENIREFFSVDSVEKVIFTPGCTHSLNMIIHGILKNGDHVVISSLEHNAVLRPLEKLKNEGFITYSVAKVFPCDDEKTISSFRNAINDHTRMIICTHASNVFGVRLPIERLCALAHSYDVVFCVDAAQSAGILPIDMQEGGYDFVCCPGHKGLYGPMGIGLLLIGGSNPQLDPLILGGTGSDSQSPAMPNFLPDRLESGTLNIPGILGLSAGVDFVRNRGMQKMLDKEIALLKKLYRYLNHYDNVILYTSMPQAEHFAPVLSFNVERKTSEETAAFLDQYYRIAVRAGLHCAPLSHRSMGTLDTGTVRVAVSAITSENDINILAHAVNKFAH